jgi:D-sedoheptulose 7-phosphate isomerase
VNSFAENYLVLARRALDTIDFTAVNQAIEWFREARDQRRSIFVFGNGGSAATANHLVTDVLKAASYGRERRFRIMTLAESIPTVTAYANDVSYECALAEQLKNFAQPGDLVMGISGSGNSPNVLRAIEYANAAGCRTIGLTGRDGGSLGAMVGLNIQVSEPHMGRIEDVHLMICHMIAYYFVDAE